MASLYVRYPGTSSGSGGVTSLNTLTGALTLAAGTGISITPSGSTLTIANTGPGGTVTSVGLADSTGLFNVTGSPVTSSGTLTLASFKSQAQNTFFAAPNGASGAPTFRLILPSDIPTLPYLSTTLGTANGLSVSTNTLSLGTASTSTTGALTSTDWNTFNSKGSGSVTSVGMTVPSLLSVSPSSITTSGTFALTYSGTALPVANGGTGSTSQNFVDLTTTQTVAGAKTFSTAPIFSTLTTAGVLLNSATGQVSSSAGALAVANGGTAKTTVTIAPTASSWAGWDANSNLSTTNILTGFTTTATAAGTTTLTIASTYYQVFTGSTTQTVTLPTTSVVTGTTYQIINDSTGNVTVNASGGTTVQVMASNTMLRVVANIATPTLNTGWEAVYISKGTVPVALGGTGLTALTANNVILGNGTSSPTFVAPSTSGNVLTSNGTTWQSTAPTSAATGSYAQGYLTTGTAWSTTSTTFADPTNGVGSTLTIRQNSGITNFLVAGSNLCGISFTPASASAVYLIHATFASYNSAANAGGAYQLTDGTTVIASQPGFQGTAATVYPNTLNGIYVPGTSSAVTVKIQAATIAGGTVFIDNPGSLGPIVEWTIVRIA